MKSRRLDRHHHAGADREAGRGRYDPDRRRRQAARVARCTGYRHDSERHYDARMKIPAARRRQIARDAAAARWS